MDRGARRNIERAIRKLIKRSGDNCTICGAEFQHNTRTSGGLTADGKVALAGECCADKIAKVVTSGVFANRNHDDLKALAGRHNDGPTPSPEQMEEVLSAIQEGLTGRDKIVSDVQRRAGIQSKNSQLSLSDSPWKTDDAAWFTAHPTRSHRLRPLIANEGTTIPPTYFESLPPGHEVQIVVRQVEPGKRVRTAFGRNMAVPIPDDEQIIHAIFDMIYNVDRTTGVIGVREVAELANAYAASIGSDSREN